MPLTQIRHLSEHVALGFWKMTESPDKLRMLLNLNSIDAQAYERLLNEKAQKQWLCARMLLKEMCGEKVHIVYDIYGKPYCDGISGISISHSGEYVLLAINSFSEIGADIELIANRIERITHKFISPSEECLHKQLPHFPPHYFYHLIWSFKEAVYKLHGKKGLLFKEHILLKELNNENGQFLRGVLIIKGQEVAVNGQFFLADGYVVCVCSYA